MYAYQRFVTGGGGRGEGKIKISFAHLRLRTYSGCGPEVERQAWGGNVGCQIYVQGHSGLSSPRVEVEVIVDLKLPVQHAQHEEAISHVAEQNKQASKWSPRAIPGPR